MERIPFHVMVKPVGPLCNLQCAYCFYLEKKKILDTNKVMSFEVLQAFTQQYIKDNPSNEIVFGWQGGEPTLASLDFFNKVIEFQKKYNDGRKIVNTLQTNGILLDKKWANFLAENKFLVGISIDGPTHVHDRFRTTRDGKGTFDKVIESIQLLKQYGVEFNTLTCIHRKNWMRGKEIYHFLKSIGSKYMQFIPIVERMSRVRNDNLSLSLPTDETAELTEWSILPDQWGNFLITIFDEWLKQDVGTIFVQLFDVMLAGWIGINPPLCIFSQRCGNMVVLESNGDVYSCDHYVYPEYRLGNIMEMPLIEIIHSEPQRKFGLEKQNLSSQCKTCEFLHLCHGGCPKHRFIYVNNERLNFLCEGLRKFFKHTKYPMKIMAEQLKLGLPPRNIREYLQRNKIQFSSNNIPPNNICPCGSGKKFKKCCGSLFE